MTNTPLNGEQTGTPRHEVDANVNFLLVKVRVTLAGEAVWNRYFSSARETHGDLPDWRLQRDEDGYTTMELAKMIRIFGSDLTNPVVPLPVDMDFKIITEA